MVHRFLMAQVLRYGIRKDFTVISILVVSTTEFCGKISFGLLNCKTSKKQRILVHKCESIAEIIAKHKNLHVDFIVFAIDSRLTQSLKEVEKNISLIDQSFILHGNVCLVNGNQISVSAMGVSLEQIWDICVKYNLRRLNANVFVQEDSFYLADQIITLASAVLGQKSGFPLLSAPVQFKEEPSADDFTD